MNGNKYFFTPKKFAKLYCILSKGSDEYAHLPSHPKAYTAWLLGNFACFFVQYVVCLFFQNQLFQSILLGIPLECQTVGSTRNLGPNCFQRLSAWVKVQNLQNPELLKLQSLTLLYAYLIFTISSFNGQLSLDRLKINQRSYYDLPNSAFWGGLSVESQPENPEFRNNPENFHQCISRWHK